MSKVAQYLNEHILGEVITDPAVRAMFATDASVLSIMPEMVMYPRVTNDIRKVARFAWQLAEKGHVLPLTARGGGSDDTGAAIGKGIVISMTAHMNSMYEYDAKQKLARMQPGVTIGTVQTALALQGLGIPALVDAHPYGTIGGAIAYSPSSAQPPVSGKQSDIWVHQLEVVLANGEVLQTSRLSKRELGKKKGLQGLEGDIYRKLDGLIDDSKQLINDKLSDPSDAVGYSSISEVKRHDGSFDLTPLIAGSQGTLGIISELIVRAEFMNASPSLAFLTFSESNGARDAVDTIEKLNPDLLEYYDAAYFTEALRQGKHYGFYDAALVEGSVAAVLCVRFDDFSKHARSKNMKKLAKIASTFGGYIAIGEGEDARELGVARDVTSFTLLPGDGESAAPPLFDNAYVPFDRFEDFSAAVKMLADKHHVTLPLYARPLDGIVRTRPQLQMHKVGDKQKIFKLLDEYATLIAAHNGYLISETEGRFKANSAYKQVDDDLQDLFKAVKDIFDPLGILNPGVKQPNDLKQIVATLRPSYDTAMFANFVPRS